MDQFKTQLAAVKQHSFWAMCIGILLISIGSWWVSTGKLKDEQTKQIAAIDGGFSSLNQIKTTPDHPNPKTNEGMDALNRKYAQEVANGWKLQYDQQVDVLQWPEGFAQSGFKAFVDRLRPIEKIPVNANGQVNIKDNDNIPREYTEEYRNYVEEELPKLAKIIGARWMVSTQGDPSLGGGAMPGASMPGGPGGLSGGFGGGMPGALGPGGAPMGLDASGMPVVIDDSVVAWDPANQQEILTTHFGFTMRTPLPTTLEVLYAQEDYWVFDNIMQIIRETNKVDEQNGKPIYASARHEAVIKRIDFIRIGRSARGLAGKVVPVGRAAATGEMGGMPSPGGETGSAMAPGGGSADGGGMPAPGGDGMGGMESMLARDPAMYRYVTEKFEPLDPAKLRSALTSKSPEDALYAVAKRMPVRIAVGIDQRKLNILLAECGNSKLPVEVHQVRINRPLTPAAAGGGGSYAGGGMPGGDMAGPGSGGFTSGLGSSDSGGGGGFGGAFGGGGNSFGGSSFGGSSFGGSTFGGASGLSPGGGGEYGGMPGGGMPGGSGRIGFSQGSLTQDARVDPNMIEVELYGVVYIYNPVNLGLLGLDVPAPGAPADGSTPAPADATPPVDAAANASPNPPANQTIAAPGAE